MVVPHNIVEYFLNVNWGLSLHKGWAVVTPINMVMDRCIVYMETSEDEFKTGDVKQSNYLECSAGMRPVPSFRTPETGRTSSDPIVDSLHKAYFGEHIPNVGMWYPVKGLLLVQADESGVQPPLLHVDDHIPEERKALRDCPARYSAGLAGVLVSSTRNNGWSSHSRMLLSKTSMTEDWNDQEAARSVGFSGEQELFLCTFWKKKYKHISSCSMERILDQKIILEASLAK
eukprot:g46907.t1